MQKLADFRVLAIAALLLAVSACGFHMRGVQSLPFETLYLQESGAPSIAKDLKRSLVSSGVKLVTTPEQAQASLDLMKESYEKRILSLSGSGRVREYQLIYTVTFRLREAGTELWGEPQSTELRRDFTYNDAQTLAKDVEEARLATDMRNEASREVLRRVSSLSKNKPAAAE